MLEATSSIRHLAGSSITASIGISTLPPGGTEKHKNNFDCALHLTIAQPQPQEIHLHKYINRKKNEKVKLMFSS